VASPPNIDADSNEALLAGLARTGDRDAFAELVRRRQSWIRGLMRRLCHHAALGDDLAQQAFLQAWRRIGKLRQPQQFGAWLKRIAVNCFLQEVRRRDVLADAEAEADPDRAPGPDAAAGVDLDLARALAGLSAKERLCVVLAYHESQTHAEIADLTGMPLGTVKSHIRRGTERLRERLASYGPEEDTP